MTVSQKRQALAAQFVAQVKRIKGIRDSDVKSMAHTLQELCETCVEQGRLEILQDMGQIEIPETPEPCKERASTGLSNLDSILGQY